MKGADEYYTLIKNANYYKVGNLQQIIGNWGGGDCVAYRNGNVVYVTGSHARGRTFNIYLFDDEKNIEASRFEVYGIVSGNPGWTEEYGWIRKGAWVNPILQYFSNLEKEIELHKKKLEDEKRQKQREISEETIKKIDKFNNMFKTVEV